MASYNLANYDFQSIKNALYADLLTYPEWSGLPADQDSADSIVKLLIYLLTYNSSLEVGFLNSGFQDSIPSLSTSYNVIYSFANLIGMKIKNLTSASGLVDISIPDTSPVAAKQIILPFGMQISDSTGQKIFSLAQSAFIPVGERSVSVFVSGQSLTGPTAPNYTYSFTTSKKPIVKSSVAINFAIGATVYVVSDDGNGNLVGTHVTSGTVDYINGIVTLRLDAAATTTPVISFYYKGTIPVVQGVFKTQTYVGTGNDYQKFYIFDTVEEYNTSMTVDGVAYTEVDSFLFSTNTDYHYIVRRMASGIFIETSNGVNGAKPGLNSVVSITYLVSGGTSGNIYSPAGLQTILSKVTDIDGGTVTGLVVTNPAPVIGGYDGDDLQTIRRNIQLFFSSINLSTRESYQDYTKTSPLVLDVKCSAGWEVYPADSTKWTTIYFYVLPAQYPQTRTLSVSDKTALFNYLKLRDVFYTFLQFEDLNYIGVILEIGVRLSSTLLTAASINGIKNSIYNGINGIVDNYFNFSLLVSQSGTAFRSIYRTDLSSQIVALANVRSADLNLWTVEDTKYLVDALTDSWSGYNLILTELNPDETYLYIGNTKIGRMVPDVFGIAGNPFSNGSSWCLVPEVVFTAAGSGTATSWTPGTTGSFTIALNLTPGTVILHYVIGTTDYYVTDNGDGHFYDATIVSGTVDYDTGIVNVTFTATVTPDPTYTYNYSDRFNLSAHQTDLSFGSTNIVLNIATIAGAAWTAFKATYAGKDFYIRSAPQNGADIITANPNTLFEFYSATVSII